MESGRLSGLPAEIRAPLRILDRQMEEVERDRCGDGPFRMAAFRQRGGEQHAAHGDGCRKVEIDWGILQVPDHLAAFAMLRSGDPGGLYRDRYHSFAPAR